MDIKRVLTSVLGLPCVIAILILGNNIVIDIFFAIVALISIKEYYDAFEKSGNAKPIRWIGYIVALSISILRFLHLQSSLIPIDQNMQNVMFAFVIVSFFIIVFHILNSNMKRNVVDGAVTMFGIIYIPVLIMFLPILRGAKNGIFLIWYAIICGWTTDIFAYLTGKFLGNKKHKFSKISPNKSIEGCIIGAVGAMVISIIYTIICNTYFYTNISYIYIIIVSIVLSVIGQVGDFAASSIKRYNGIKDFSNLIPGHRRNAR
ncbi:MAG: phosphatidate cytidylyltransferase [Clostridia bacterium]|jgi:phosphatidate cytidylyltransferase|nr:phosphatidate cytidylyltransferase [Clostridia bacterium]